MDPHKYGPLLLFFFYKSTRQVNGERSVCPISGTTTMDYPCEKELTLKLYPILYPKRTQNGGLCVGTARTFNTHLRDH